MTRLFTRSIKYSALFIGILFCLGMSFSGSTTYYVADINEVPEDVLLSSVTISTASTQSSQLNLSDIINAASVPPVIFESTPSPKPIPADNLLKVTSSGVA